MGKMYSNMEKSHAPAPEKFVSDRFVHEQMHSTSDDIGEVRASDMLDALRGNSVRLGNGTLVTSPFTGDPDYLPEYFLIPNEHGPPVLRKIQWYEGEPEPSQEIVDAEAVYQG